jgi:hypothetical protein
MILDSAVDRLLPMETYRMREHFRSFALHEIGEHATHPIARFKGSRPLLLLNHIGSHAASSPLQGASALARADRFAGSQHAARNPCSTLARQPSKRAIGRVQLWNLG